MPVSPAAACWSAGLVCLTLSACSYPTTAAEFVSAAATPLGLTFTSDPPPAADGSMARDGRMIAQLDGYVEPASVMYGVILLRSGVNSFDFTATTDFLRQQVILQPRTLLAPVAQYDLNIDGLSTLDGRKQDGVAAWSYQVGVTLAGPPAPPPTVTWAADIAPLFARSCVTGCHGRSDASGRAITPARTLDLSGDPLDPVYGVVGVPALGVPEGLPSLERVAPGDPSRSALMRKLVGGDPTADSVDPAYPSLGVEGRRMPIPADPTQPGVPLDAASLQLVEDWIAGGAR